MKIIKFFAIGLLSICMLNTSILLSIEIEKKESDINSVHNRYSTLIWYVKRINLEQYHYENWESASLMCKNLYSALASMIYYSDYLSLSQKEEVLHTVYSVLKSSYSTYEADRNSVFVTIIRILKEKNIRFNVQDAINFINNIEISVSQNIRSYSSVYQNDHIIRNNINKILQLMKKNLNVQDKSVISKHTYPDIQDTFKAIINIYERMFEIQQHYEHCIMRSIKQDAANA